MYFIKRVETKCKVGCVFLMVIWSEFRLGKYRDDDHREDASHFIIIHRVQFYRGYLRLILKIYFKVGLVLQTESRQMEYQMNEINLFLSPTWAERE